MKLAALVSAMNLKDNQKHLIKIDKLELEAVKTKLMEGFVLLKTKSLNCLVIVSQETYTKYSISARNLAFIKMTQFNNINLLDLLNHNFVIIDKYSQDYLKHLSSDKDSDTKTKSIND